MTKLVELPQDIIDNVIAAGSDDTDLLKQCSLVSSSFLHTSRKHLFSRITIGSYETCQGIHQFLIQNPVVQTFVRAITLTESMPYWPGGISPPWLNGTSLLAILRLPFRCLECFSIVLREYDDILMSLWLFEDAPAGYWDWNDFSSEMKDALSNIILSSTLKTICLDGIVNVPTTFFLHITHLTTLELHSLAPNCFYDENSSTLTRAASKGVEPLASHTVIDRCVWRFGAKHAYRPIDMIFLPFMCGLRFFEVYLDLEGGTERDFNVFFFLIGSLSISLTSSEHLEFNIRFRYGNSNNINPTFYENFRNAWSLLDSITYHHSRLQRVEININYACYCEHDDGTEPDKDEFLKAVFDGLPLLHAKGILFVEAVLGKY